MDHQPVGGNPSPSEGFVVASVDTAPNLGEVESLQDVFVVTDYRTHPEIELLYHWMASFLVSMLSNSFFFLRSKISGAK